MMAARIRCLLWGATREPMAFPNAERGHGLLRPPATTLERWPVSKRVNSSRAPADDPDLIERVEALDAAQNEFVHAAMLPHRVRSRQHHGPGPLYPVGGGLDPSGTNGGSQNARFAVADHVVSQLKNHSDPWELSDEAKSNRGPTT
jgi:hypothetical protein